MSRARSTAQAKVPAPLERDIAKGVVKAFRLWGIALERQNTGVGTFRNRDGSTRTVRFGKRGNLDYRAILPGGRVLEVEIKRPGKKPTAAQLVRIREINAADGRALWLDDAAEAFEAARKLAAGGVVAEGPEGVFRVTDGNHS